MPTDGDWLKARAFNELESYLYKLGLLRKASVLGVLEGRCRTSVPQAGYRILYKFLSIKM